MANNIDKQTHRYLTPENPKAGRFYVLPKIHKPGNPGRPIVSANGHPTEKISEFVSFHLNPLVQTLPSHVKNSTHLLNKLQDFDDIPPNALLVTLDVSSLYTNIPDRPPRALTHVENYWTNELINPFLLKPDVT